MAETMRMTPQDTEAILIFYQIMNGHQGHDLTYGEMKVEGSGNPDFPLLGCRCNSCDHIISLIQLPRAVMDQVMSTSGKMAAPTFLELATCGCACGCKRPVERRGINCPQCSVGKHLRTGDTD